MELFTHQLKCASALDRPRFDPAAGKEIFYCSGACIPSFGGAKLTGYTPPPPS